MQQAGERMAQSRTRAFGFDEVLVSSDVLSADEQKVLVDWSEERRGEGRLLKNPIDALTRSTPYRRSTAARPS